MTKNNRGAALITVMVIVFIVMTIIASLATTNFRMYKRLVNRQLREQSTTIAYSALDFGRAALGTSGATSSFDSLQDVWAQGLPKTKVLDDIYMSGSVVDEQSKFNINDLVSQGIVNPNVLNQFSLLLQYLNIPPSLAYNIAYYIAAPQYQGDIMSQYTMGKPAYSPAGRPFVDLSELILVKGVNQDIVQKLVKYVTAVPVNGSTLQNESSIESAPSSGFGYGTIVNVNTASAEVIAAKSGIPLPVAQRMISYRSAQPFNNTQAVTTFLSQNGVNTSSSQPQPNSKNQLNLAGLGVSSSYFTIHAVVDDQGDEFRFVAFVFRQNRSGQWPQILWQHPE